MEFSQLGLRPALLRRCESLGYTEPTAIQERAIPIVLTGADLIGCAETGTGKTAAFLLPIIQRMSRDAAPRRARARARADARAGHTDRRPATSSSPRRAAPSVRPSSAARACRARPTLCAAARASSSPRRAACSTTSSAARSTSRTSKCSSSTRPTGCSTWASCPPSAAYSRSFPRSGRRSSSPRRCRARSKSWRARTMKEPQMIEVNVRGRAAVNVEQMAYTVAIGVEDGSAARPA